MHSVGAEAATAKLQLRDRAGHVRLQPVDHERVHALPKQVATLTGQLLIPPVAIKQTRVFLLAIYEQFCPLVWPVNKDIHWVAALIIVVKVYERILVKLYLLVKGHPEENRRAQFAGGSCLIKNLVHAVATLTWLNRLVESNVAPFRLMLG